jgi:hypothetical protein
VKSSSAMTKTSCPDRANLWSARTSNYFEALVREGDNFDYRKWLKRVREEESQAKPVGAASTSGELTAAQIADPIKTSGNQHVRPNPALSLKTLELPIARRPNRQAKSQTRQARLRRWLEKVHRAWCDFQSSRRRDGVYEYLEAVFAIVEHYRVRRRTKRLLRRAFEFANLPLEKQANARCTSDRDIDSKTISKWARALRYVARRKGPDMRLKTFMKEAGGVNAVR